MRLMVCLVVLVLGCAGCVAPDAAPDDVVIREVDPVAGRERVSADFLDCLVVRYFPEGDAEKIRDVVPEQYEMRTNVDGSLDGRMESHAVACEGLEFQGEVYEGPHGFAFIGASVTPPANAVDDFPYDNYGLDVVVSHAGLAQALSELGWTVHVGDVVVQPGGTAGNEYGATADGFAFGGVYGAAATDYENPPMFGAQVPHRIHRELAGGQAWIDVPNSWHSLTGTPVYDVFTFDVEGGVTGQVAESGQLIQGMYFRQDASFVAVGALAPESMP